MNALRIASLLVAGLCCLGVGCGSDTPVPDYPFPETRNLEDTDLAEFVAGDEEVMEEDEDWDDGLGDEDMMMENAPAQDAAE